MDEQLNYEELLEKYRWPKEKNKKAVISPDIDGFLCGLLVSYYLGWEIVGLYDGGDLLIEGKNEWKECVFIDMEIYREEVCSIGNHLLLYNKNKKPKSWVKFRNCINPNNLRNFDKVHDFKNKYPFGTIHFLICLLSKMDVPVDISKEAIGIILFADGVFKSIMNYPENCVDWLSWLKAKELSFFNRFSETSISDIVHRLQRIFGELNLRFGKLPLKNISQDTYEELSNKLLNLLDQLSDWTGWKLKQNCWKVLNFNNLCNPVIIKRKRAEKINNSKYQKILNTRDIISFSFPTSSRLEYSIAKNKRL
jgi:hypothetical protein